MREKITLVADMDLSKMSGDVIRTIAFATELQKNGFNVTLLTPKPNGNISFELDGINMVHMAIPYNGGSVLNIFNRTFSLIKEAKKLRNNPLIIETSPLGGYFALFGFSNYILDVHGIHFSEIDYAAPPWYISKRIYKKLIRFLEKLALKKAFKINVVSENMAQFIITEFNVQKEKITVIPNGYFNSKVIEVSKKVIKEKKGAVTFVGNLAKWARADKIVNVAKVLKNEEVTFYIVGGGIYSQKLEDLVDKYKLSNIVFTGYVPLEQAYEMIASSQIMLLLFPQDICTEVACPIKVLEYMAFGKAMVIDEVDEISKILKENSAALVCDPDNEEDFAENIRFLLKNEKMRRKIGNNARLLSKEFSWENQGQKLVEVLENING